MGPRKMGYGGWNMSELHSRGSNTDESTKLSHKKSH
jgi:hypothetical protein